MFGVKFGAVAGIVVLISSDKFFTTAGEYVENHLSIYGFIAGMNVMEIGLLLFM